MHHCVQMDASRIDCTLSIADYPLCGLFGTGDGISVRMEKWGLITPERLENAAAKIQEGGAGR